ncbi:AMP-dependent synthetase/ligase [Angustibacter sp. McL0619]|uniref:AMP-dependent synthetase/ligase n=1 Tax=Angustibacter sp. McL0619 TaxID=3415676 RepID=UPI003CF06A16
MARPEEVARFEELHRQLPASLGALLGWRVGLTPDVEAFRSQADDGTWTTWTWRDVAGAVDEIAAGLLALGLAPQQRVAIASSTRVEWVLADLAVMRAGGATTTIYPSSTPADVRFILADSESVVVFAEDATQLAKVRDHWAGLSQLRALVVLDPDALGPDSQHAGDANVMTLDALRERGRRSLDADPDVVRTACATVRSDHLATLIYTSGTTGQPKGVRLLHSAWVYQGASTAALGLLTPQDLQYLWLPLSHVFGKGLLTTQLVVGFPSAVCGDLDRLIDNLATVRPTFMAGAPRIYEKVHARVRTQLESERAARARLAAWAIDVGRQVSVLHQRGQQPSTSLAVQHALAKRLVLSKITARFGGRIRYFVAGSAALSKEVAQWFHAVGILVLEGYGLTESSAASFINRPEGFAFGTVGQPFPGTEVRLEEDGEVLLRSPGVMAGYHGLEHESGQVLDDDGWLHTGDIGEFVDGCLKITDRKKDLIKTSGGKYVAPQGIESRFKAVCPYAAQIVVHGDGRRYITALVTLDADAMATWAQHHDMAGAPYEEIVASPAAREMVQRCLDELNDGLGRWETIKRFEILERDLTIESGELTPSLKLRRRVVERRYGDLLDALYDEPAH